MTSADLAAIHEAAFSETRPWSETEFTNLLVSAGVFLVTETKGFALGRVIAGEAELLTIAVHPDVQRQGIGGRCLTSFHDKARSLGAETAFLEVAADNSSAIALYRAARYRESGRRALYYKRADGTRSDALILQISLN